MSGCGESDRGQTAYTYRLCDIVHYDGAVCVSVVHRRQPLVALLAGRVPVDGWMQKAASQNWQGGGRVYAAGDSPNLKLDCCLFI